MSCEKVQLRETKRRRRYDGWPPLFATGKTFSAVCEPSNGKRIRLYILFPTPNNNIVSACQLVTQSGN